MNKDQINQALARMPFAETLGVTPLIMGNEFTLVLPYNQSNIGNPVLPALHGGAIGGFMEITAIVQLILQDTFATTPKPIGINIDYLRRGKPVETFARAQIFKRGKRVSNVRVRAWQDDYENPIATLHGHFLTQKTEGV